jgi:hypothetical protein
MMMMTAFPSPLVWLVLLVLSSLCLTRHGAVGEDATGGGDVPSDLSGLTMQDLLSACPTEIARVTPCIDSSMDLTNCTGCVSTFLASSFSTTGAAEGANATSPLSSCDRLQSSVCDGIDDCGSTCGLVGQDSWFTFGSNCEDLFLNLVACVMDSQGVSVEGCSLAGASCVDGGAGGGDATDGAGSLRTFDRTTMIMGSFVAMMSAALMS